MDQAEAGRAPASSEYPVAAILWEPDWHRLASKYAWKARIYLASVGAHLPQAFSEAKHRLDLRTRQIHLCTPWRHERNCLQSQAFLVGEEFEPEMARTWRSLKSCRPYHHQSHRH